MLSGLEKRWPDKYLSSDLFLLYLFLLYYAQSKYFFVGDAKTFFKISEVTTLVKNILYLKSLVFDYGKQFTI